MTKVTVMEPSKTVAELQAENTMILQELQRERSMRADVQYQPTRLQGWHIVTMVLGGLFMVMSLVWSLMNKALQVSEIAAERSHELAMQAVTELGDQMPYDPAVDIAIYVGLFLAGFLVIWFVTSKAGVTP